MFAKRIKNLVAFVVLMVVFAGLSAQNLQWYWQVTPNGHDQVYDLTIDPNGDILVCGRFHPPLDFDPGPDTLMVDSTYPTGIYVVKFTPSRHPIWVRNFPMTVSSSFPRIKTDASGNVYLGGTYAGEPDCNPGGAGGVLSNPGVLSSFVIKYDPQGNFLWARALEAQDVCITRDMDVGADGSVYLTGYFTDTVDLEPGPGTAIHTVHGRWFMEDAFVVKLNPDGNYRWSRIWGFGEDDRGGGIAVHGDQVSLLSVTRDTVDLDLGPGVNLHVPTTTLWENPLITLDTAGNYRWAFVLSNHNSPGPGPYLATDANGNLYTTGNYDGSMDADPGPGVQMLYGLDPSHYIASYSSTGTYRWAVDFGNDSTMSSPLGFCTTSDGLYFAGRFQGELDFDPDPMTEKWDTATSYMDAFLLRLDLDGNYAQHLAFGGQVGNPYSTKYFTSVAATDDGTVYVGGYFQPYLDVDPGSTYELLTSTSGGGIVIRLGTCAAEQQSESTTLCNSSYTFGGQTLTSSGTYSHTFTSIYGCDSVVHLTLNLGGQLAAGISPQGNSLLASPSGLQYQWIDCGNGNQVIPGATQALFYPALSGSYACIVNDGTCQVTTPCQNLTVVGTPEVTAGHPHLYPNPSQGTIWIEAPEPITSIRIVDALGQVVHAQNGRGGTVAEVDWQGPAGTYFVEVFWGRNHRSSSKLVRVQR